MEDRLVREFTRMITNMNEEWKYLLCSSQRQISFIACGEVEGVMDFTLTTYQELLSTLKDSGYTFQTFVDFIRKPEDKVVVMRHDVDRLPGNALKMARIEHGMGITATYYFRAVPVSWDEGIIREIAGMGHEVGYHYENLESVVSSQWSEVSGQRSVVRGQWSVRSRI